jgi:hypothetical protein
VSTTARASDRIGLCRATIWWVLITKLFLRRDADRDDGEGNPTARPGADTIANRFALFEAGEYEVLVKWMCLATRSAAARARKKAATRESLRDKALYMLSVHQLRRAVRYLLSDGAADLDTPRVAMLYRDKQLVPRHRPIPAGLPQVLEGVRNSVRLRDKYRKLDAQAAPGPSGAHNAHLKVLSHATSDALGKTAVAVHEEVAALHLSGLMPSWYYRLTGSALAVALWKKPALPHLPKGIRPLGLGDVQQRAWESCFVAAETEAVRVTFWNAGQVSTGVGAGTEKVGFGHRAHHEAHVNDAPVDILDVHVTLSPDSANAFPTTSRAQAIAEAAARPRFRKMALLLNTISKQESAVVNVAGATINEGMKQGQASGTFAHNTCTLPHCERANADLRAAGGLASFITDDGVFTGPLRHVLRVWDRYRRDVKTFCGSDTNLDKTVIYAQTNRMAEVRAVLDANPDWRHVRFDSTQVSGREHYGIEIGGIPIGEDEYIRAALDRKLEKSTGDFKQIILELGDTCPQAAYAIVSKHFLAEWVHTLRTVYPSLTTPYARRMDDVIERGLASMTHTRVPTGSLAAARVRQPLSKGGGAIRKLVDVAAPAFLGAACQCVPSFDDTPTADGQVELGLLRHLPEFYGAGSFVTGNTANRFTAVLGNGSRLAAELASAWRRVTQGVSAAWRLDPDNADKMLAGPIDALGTVGGRLIPKVQRMLTHELEAIQLRVIKERAAAALACRATFMEAASAWTTGGTLSSAAAEVEEAIAERCVDAFAGEFLMALPAKGKRLRPEQWRMLYARRFGLECPECSPHQHVMCGRTRPLYDTDSATGLNTLRPGSGLQIKVGRYGRGLTLGSRAAVKGFQNLRHDCGVLECFNAMRRAGVLARLEPSDLWQHLILNVRAWNSAAKQVRSACIPDIEEDRGGGDIKLLDGKFWSACTTWFRHAWLSRGISVAHKRQVEGSRHMAARLRAADLQWNTGVPRNARGHRPIEAAAQAYGRIEIIGCGPYGEVTPDTSALVKRVAARAAAAGWRPMGARSAVEAQGVLASRFRQHIGVAFSRHTAEFTLRRLRYELHRSRAPQSSGTARRRAAERSGAAASDAYDARSRFGPGAG